MEAKAGPIPPAPRARADCHPPLRAARERARVPRNCALGGGAIPPAPRARASRARARVPRFAPGGAQAFPPARGPGARGRLRAAARVDAASAARSLPWGCHRPRSAGGRRVRARAGGLRAARGRRGQRLRFRRHRLGRSHARWPAAPTGGRPPGGRWATRGLPSGGLPSPLRGRGRIPSAPAARGAGATLGSLVRTGEKRPRGRHPRSWAAARSEESIPCRRLAPAPLASFWQKQSAPLRRPAARERPGRAAERALDLASLARSVQPGAPRLLVSANVLGTADMRLPNSCKKWHLHLISCRFVFDGGGIWRS